MYVGYTAIRSTKEAVSEMATKLWLLWALSRGRKVKGVQVSTCLTSAVPPALCQGLCAPGELWDQHTDLSHQLSPAIQLL